MTTYDCRALLFDLDGVLVDSTECVERTWRRWAARHGLDPAAILAVAHGRRAPDTVRLVAPHLDADAEWAALIDAEAEEAQGVREVPGACALLAGLPRRAWAVVTSGARRVAEFRLRVTGLPMPEVLVCADEIARGKPDPEGYLAAAARLGVAPPACLVIEDAPAGLEAARAAGMRTLALETTHRAEQLGAADAIVPTLAAIRVDVRPGRLSVALADE